jgi:hypothetical protein
MPFEGKSSVPKTSCPDWVNWQQEELSCLGEGRQHFIDGTSRMTRECHVRIGEGLDVKFPGLLGKSETCAVVVADLAEGGPSSCE